MLTSENYETLLSFVRGLPAKGSNFLRDTLNLFSEYFSLTASLMIAYHQPLADTRKGGVGYGYVVRNLQYDEVKPYFSEFFKTDVFNRAHIKRSASVVTLSQIAGTEKLDHLPYYQYIQSLGFAYQAVIFLRKGKQHLATISLFRSQELGDFTETELEMLRALEPFITKQYYQILDRNRFSNLKNHFDILFENVKLGVALLDSNRTVLKANDSFSQYCHDIVEYGSIRDVVIMKSKEDINQDYIYPQLLLNYFGEHVLSRPGKIKMECLIYYYRFHLQPIYSKSSESIDGIENQYLLFLIRHEKIRSPDMLRALDRLTPKELSVLSYLASGMSNAEIADMMVISQYTVKTHLQNIYSKCNVSGKSELLSKLK